MPVIAMRDVTTSLPGLADSSVLMSIDGIKGSCMIPEYAGWMPLTGFEWGGARTFKRQINGLDGRTHVMSVAPQMRGVQVVRAGDFRSPELWTLMLSTNKKLVQFVWLRTSSGGPTPYMKLDLENALISRMSEHSGGDQPEESIMFSYEEITLTVVNVGNRLSGPQDVVRYKLPQSERG